MRYARIPYLVGFSLALAACGGNKSSDDDNGGDTGGGTGGTSATGGTSGKAGTGATGGTTGATGGTAGSAGNAGAATQPLPGGPHPFPQNKKPPFCSLTTAANPSDSVQAAYNFWKQQFVVAAGGGLRVQRDANNANDTVSEGIGYGMLIAVYMNDRTTFDGIWTYAKQHRDGVGLMNWHINADGTNATGGTGSATDADEDMAYALIMASSQWSNGTYLDDGRTIAKAILANSVAGDGTLKPGDSWGGTTTYPDYFSPAYYRVFMSDAVAAGNPTYWKTVITRNYEILGKVTGQYGLVPDSTTGDTYDLTQTYKYDACRTPWRIGMDYCFYGTTEAQTYLQLIGGFFDTQGVANIGDGYSLTGSKTSNYGNMAFIGPAGVAGMEGFPKLLNDAFAYGANGMGGSTLYFQQSLRVITMLMMSGNFVDYTLAP